MRQIELEGKVYTTTQEVIDALAWATVRRGRTRWTGDNVIRQVHIYLLDHGADAEKYNLKRLTYVMKQLSDAGYATLTTVGKRYTSFEFKDDVDLRFDPPSFTQVKAFADPDVVVETPKETPPLAVEGVKVSTHATGLPILSARPERYKAEELSKLLDEFADHDPEAYADYADATITGLRSLLAK